MVEAHTAGSARVRVVTRCNQRLGSVEAPHRDINADSSAADKTQWGVLFKSACRAHTSCLKVSVSTEDSAYKAVQDFEVILS